MIGQMTLSAMREVILGLAHKRFGSPAATSREFVWYLATPYTHPSRLVREDRADEAARWAGLLLEGGLNVFSPIAAHHAASMHMHEQPSHAGWMDICYAMLDRCDGLMVVMMDGWRESEGVRLEIARWVERHYGSRARLVYASMDHQPVEHQRPVFSMVAENLVDC